MPDTHVVTESEQPSHLETDVFAFIPRLQTKTGLSCFRLYVSLTAEVRTYTQSDHFPVSMWSPKQSANQRESIGWEAFYLHNADNSRETHLVAADTVAMQQHMRAEHWWAQNWFRVQTKKRKSEFRVNSLMHWTVWLTEMKPAISCSVIRANVHSPSINVHDGDNKRLSRF